MLQHLCLSELTNVSHIHGQQSWTQGCVEVQVRGWASQTSRINIKNTIEEQKMGSIKNVQIAIVELHDNQWFSISLSFDKNF